MSISRNALLGDLALDVRYAFRTLRRQPGFTAVTVLTLALGIGATVTLFTLADAVLLRPLPFPDADRLVRIEERRGGQPGRTPWTLTNGAYNAWLEKATTIEGLGAWIAAPRTLVGDGQSERLEVADATPSLFGILRASPAIGRPFTEADAEPGAPPTVMLSHGFWQQRFGGQPSVLGRHVQLDDMQYEVVGVMPSSFAFPGRDTQLWTPLRPLKLLGPDGRQMRVILVEAIARLRPGVTASQAAAEATARARTTPDIYHAALSYFSSRGELTVAASPVLDILTAEVKPAILILLVAVVLLFVTSVANVISVQFARETSRRLESAIRMALGGDLWRLVRLWLVESALVGVAAGLLGVLCASLMCDLLPSFLPADFPRLDEIRLDSRSMSFSLAITIIVSVMCGTIPPLLSQSSRVSRALSEESVAAVGLSLRTRAARVRLALMVGQVAIACMLVIVGTLLARSFVAMIHAERGYDASNLVTARVSFPHAHNMSGEQRGQILEQIQERLTATPGVRQVAFGNGLPLVHGDINFGRVIPSPRDPANKLHIAATLRVVSPDYLHALRLRVMQGRALLASDTDSSPGVIVVNQAFAREYLPGGALGERLELQLTTQPEWEVVGIVEDVRQGAITEPARPELFVSYLQDPDGVAFAPMLLVRAEGDPKRHVGTLRALVREIDSSLAIDGIMTMDDRIMSSLARPRLYAVVLGTLAVLSLVVTGVGLFGVLSYATARRQPEIGVRAALGATARDIAALVLRQAFGIVGVGIALGVTAALVGATWLSAVLYGIAPRDGLSFVVGPLAIIFVALAAVIVPARRAIRVDPLRALRSR